MNRAIQAAVFHKSLIDYLPEEVIGLQNFKADLEKATRAVKIETERQEEEDLAESLKRFLQWLEPILAVNTAGCEPVLFSQGAKNVFREDRAESSDPSALQEESPLFEEGFYRVPPIID